jgi:NAD(P)-dependent dehydrogenase (short-subunit alcohol dehydrogenase family)
MCSARSSSSDGVVVTGGAKGIGRAIVDRLASDGFLVVCVDSDPDGLDRLPRAPLVVPLLGDVSEEGVLERAADLVQERGSLIGWVNNAALMSRSGPIHEAQQDLLRQMLAVNVEAPYVGSAVAVKRYLASGVPGSIVNVSSLQGRFSMPDFSAYAICKGGIEALTRSIAVEYGVRGIRANAVAPGTISTARHDAHLDGFSAEDRLREEQRWASQHTLGRIGEPIEVAAVVAFLLGRESSFITGQVIAVDGGWSIKAMPLGA